MGRAVDTYYVLRSNGASHGEAAKWRCGAGVMAPLLALNVHCLTAATPTEWGSVARN